MWGIDPMAGGWAAVVAVSAMETTPPETQGREAKEPRGEARVARRPLRAGVGSRRMTDPLSEWLRACGDDDLRVIARVLAETQGFRSA
jgi:hypothetical protein